MGWKFNPFTGNFDNTGTGGSTDITGKANLALDNLAAVAINTSLISDTDSTDDLGSSSIYWANGYIDTIYTSIINGSVPNGNLSIIPNGTGYTIIGDAGTTSHTFNTNDDLLVSGRLEVNGATYIDGTFDVYGVSTIRNTIQHIVASADNNSVAHQFLKRGRSGDINGIVAADAEIGRQEFKGWDGSTYSIGASAGAKTTQIWTSTKFGSKFLIRTVADDASTLVDRLSVDSNNVISAQSIRSDTDSTDNLGSSSIYWANTYTDKLYITAGNTIEFTTDHMSINKGADGGVYLFEGAADGEIQQLRVYGDGASAGGLVYGSLSVGPYGSFDIGGTAALVVNSAGMSIQGGSLYLGPFNTDNLAVVFGAGQDASILYNGTDLIINPKLVGTGKVDISGVLQTDGYNAVDGSAGISTTVTSASLVGKTITIKDGLITGFA